MTELDKKAESMNIDFSTSVAGVSLSNPIMTASGTFATAVSKDFYDINELGAAVTKGVAPVPWDGNPAPRIAEAYGGMINSVGLQNPGVDAFIEGELKLLKTYDTKIIVNVAGHKLDDYIQVVERLGNIEEIDMLEVNISCPNLSEGGMAFGTNTDMAARVAKEVRRLTKKPLIFKLTPNVTDITEIAKAVEAAGADAVSLINTVKAMHIDLQHRRSTLANKIGGLSGPAIKPIALCMVYNTAKAVNIPVIGIGGISKGSDVAEFIAAGASAVGVGTAALVDPLAIPRIKRELIEFMHENNFETLSELRHAFAL